MYVFLPPTSMQDFSKIDKRLGLTPWSLQEHANYVASKYGSLLQDPQIAEAYVTQYEKKEEEFDVAYELQKELLKNSSITAGGEPQKLPDIQKIDWNPRPKFAPKKTAEQIAEETALKAEEKAKKDADKLAKKEEKKAEKLVKSELKKVGKSS